MWFDLYLTYDSKLFLFYFEHQCNIIEVKAFDKYTYIVIIFKINLYFWKPLKLKLLNMNNIMIHM